MTAAFWFRYGAAVATVCVTLWILARVSRRVRMRALRDRGDGLREIASIGLAPNVSVHVVRVANRDFIVAAGASIHAVDPSFDGRSADSDDVSAADPKRY